MYECYPTRMDYMKITELKQLFDKPAVSHVKDYYASAVDGGKIVSFDGDDHKIGQFKYVPQSERNKFITKLRKLGWEKIGAGGYSTVFEKVGEQYLLKVNDDFDRPYTDFVKITRRFKSTHFPIIVNSRTFKVDTRDYRIYLVEKLYKIPAPIAIELADTIRIVMRGAGTRPGDPQVQRILENQPGLLIAAKKLAANKGSNAIDMHSGNIMQRKDGTIVIIDPYTI